VKRAKGYVPKWVDLDEFWAVFEKASKLEQEELLTYARRFGLDGEMMRESERLLLGALGKKLSQETEEFLKEEPK
jgi:hypothetical protein